jgi:sortase (surface protein transpeptidase)
MNAGIRLALVPASALVAAGATLAGMAAHVTRPASAPDSSTTVPRGISTSVPAQQASPRGTTALAWSAPVRVVIPAISVNAPVTEVGLNADRTVQTPPLDNHNLVGWYKYSVTPGQVGASVIVGHVDSYTGPSVFFRLKDLRRGDVVKVGLADGHLAVFAVDGVQVASKTAFPTQAVYGGTGYPALRLVTCGGPFDYSTGHYRDNIVVYAHLVLCRSRVMQRTRWGCCPRPAPAARAGPKGLHSQPVFA